MIHSVAILFLITGEKPVKTKYMGDESIFIKTAESGAKIINF